MIDRLILVVALIGFGILTYRLLIAYQLRRTTGYVLYDPLLAAVIGRGTPVILYFTTPTCVPCRTVQAPALAKLQTELGEGLQVVKVDATEYPQDADRWGVLAAPTTFIIDAHGTTRAVNHGTADYTKLKRQLETLTA